MKDSAEGEAEVRDETGAFQRFAKVLRALVAVPKSELDEKLAKDKVGHAERHDNAGPRRRTDG